MASPLTEAVALLESAIEDQQLLATDGSFRTMLGSLPALNVHADPDLGCYLAGLLNVVGFPNHADEVLDLVRGDALAGSQLGLRVENVRGLLAVARGAMSRATTIWTTALRNAAAAAPTMRNQVRINLTLAYLRGGQIQRARVCLADLVADSNGAGIDPQAEVLTAFAELALGVWSAGEVPSMGGLDRLDRAMLHLANDVRTPSSVALNDVCQLAAVYFEVAAASGDWQHAERAVEVLETTSQRLSAILGADSPSSLAVRLLLTSAEARWGLSDHDLDRARHALIALGQTARRSGQVLGPAHPQALKARIEYASVVSAVAKAVRSLPDLQGALETLTEVLSTATNTFGPQHSLAMHASRHLYDCRVLAAELIGLDAYLVPTARPAWDVPAPTAKVEPMWATEDQMKVRVSWSQDPRGPVRLRRADREPPWTPGSSVLSGDIDSYGEEFLGTWSPSSTVDMALEAVVAREHRFYVAFAMEDNWAVVGHATLVRLPAPLDVRVRRTGDRVLASWIWPPDIRMADVAWQAPGQRAIMKRITFAEYAAQGGCPQMVGPEGGVLTVRAVGWGLDGLVLSDPATIAVDGVATEVSYQITRPGGLRALSARRREIRVLADRDIADVELTLVVSRGSTMPASPADGTVLWRMPGVQLLSGQAYAFTVELPRGLPKLSCLRCFVSAPARLTTVDPSMRELRVPA